MNDLPRRPIEPLAPPPGSFDAVLTRARYRRYRRTTAALTVTGVFFAGLAGGMAIGGPTGVREFVEAAVTGDPVPTEAPEGPQAPATVAVATPSFSAMEKKERDEETPPARSATPVVSPAPRGTPAVHGVAVSVTGDPVAGLYVYPGRAGADRFTPLQSPVGRTAADGAFSLTCPGTPVLLSPWPLNAPVQAAGSVRWAATFVGGATDPVAARNARCSRKAATETVVVVQQGSAIEGVAGMPEDCVEKALPLWVWLHNDRLLSVRVPRLRDGDGFRVAGLPPGEHVLGANGSRATFTVDSDSGATLTQDVTFSCEPGTEPDPSESATPTPSPTPSETPTVPSPSGTATAVPQPSPTATTGSPTPTPSPSP